MIYLLSINTIMIFEQWKQPTLVTVPSIESFKIPNHCLNAGSPVLGTRHMMSQILQPVVPPKWIGFLVDSTKRWPPIYNKTWGLGLGQSKNRWVLKSNYSQSINRNTPIIHPQSSTAGTWSHDGETRSTEYPAEYPGGPFHHFQLRCLWVRFRGWKIEKIARASNKLI